MPWANFHSSFAKDRSQFFLSGPLTRCLYLWETLVIWWVNVLVYITCRNFSANQNFGTGFFLQLDLKLELVPPVSTLGGFSGRTLGGGTGNYRIMVCVPEGVMCTLSLKSVGMLQSSSFIMLGRSKGICFAHVGSTFWGIGAYFVTGCFGGRFNVWCRLAATLEKYLRVAQSLTFGSIRY